MLVRVRGREQLEPMKSLIRSAVALLATFTLSLAAVPDEIRQNLDKLVPEAVRLLEAKDFAAALEVLVPPDEFKGITAKTPLAEFAAKFGESKAASLLAVLKAVKDQKPKLSDDGATATFDIPKGTSTEITRNTIVFARIDGRWFIKN
jgi:hypothetical protein